ncbi:hypothetical protein [Roseovarius nanhaiticus]|uniref:3'-5' exonuclease n=1 Tax=Roseovarius nanhaiticus TaxID=573024 RepID=UPI0024924805|nr:hypothetical protein [Roseovarius nanhaiticus]
MDITSIENFATLDFEASSLSPHSWPVEIGLSWIENGSLQTWSSLIRPASSWDLADWSPQSATVHGIPMTDLQAAPPATQVAERFLHIMGDRRLVSDAPEFETRWISRLLQVNDYERIPRIEDFDGISFALFEGFALDMLYETLERRPAPHRAGPDSARLAGAWLKASEYNSSPVR